jgi:hypothetical protein
VFDAEVLWRQPRLLPAAVRAACSAVLPSSNASMLQLIAGPPLSGSAPHYHRDALNVLFVGLKLWWLVPPEHAAFVDATALQWWASALAERSEQQQQLPALPGLLFLQGPGEAVYVPSLWGHAVLNLASSVAIACE